jgi:hypothetical protein
VLFPKGHKLVQEFEQLMDLLSWEIGIIAGVLHLKSVHVLFASGDHIGQRTKTRVAYRNAHSVVVVLLKQLN